MFVVNKAQKVGVKGTVLIPKEVRDRAGVKPNSQIIFSLNENNQILMEVISDPVTELQNMFSDLDLPETAELIQNFKKEENKLENKN